MGLAENTVSKAVVLRKEKSRTVCPPGTAFIFRDRWKNPFLPYHSSRHVGFERARDGLIMFDELVFRGIAPPSASMTEIISLRVWRNAALMNARLLRGRDIGCYCPMNWPCPRSVWVKLVNLLPSDDKDCLHMIEMLKAGRFADA
jgi:hypothetical protein